MSHSLIDPALSKELAVLASIPEGRELLVAMRAAHRATAALVARYPCTGLPGPAFRVWEAVGGAPLSTGREVALYTALLAEERPAG